MKWMRQESFKNSIPARNSSSNNNNNNNNNNNSTSKQRLEH